MTPLYDFTDFPHLPEVIDNAALAVMQVLNYCAPDVRARVRAEQLKILAKRYQKERLQ
jgi:hypothetical protein